MTLLYVHGMGGGSDSRIPKILSDALDGKVRVVVRTYSFDPEEGAAQLAAWAEELRPDLVVGESLGSLQAMRLRGVPHLYVSPSTGAAPWLGFLSWLSLVPGARMLFNRIWKPRPGDRQPLDFRFGILHKYPAHGREAFRQSPRLCPDADPAFAFFGKRDHYRRSGVVSIRLWEKYFGPGTYRIYDGTHFMEEEFIHSLLIPKIHDILHL